jgi:hypothetical protein
LANRLHWLEATPARQESNVNAAFHRGRDAIEHGE